MPSHWESGLQHMNWELQKGAQLFPSLGVNSLRKTWEECPAVSPQLSYASWAAIASSLWSPDVSPPTPQASDLMLI